MGMLIFPKQGGFESVAGFLSCRKPLKDVTFGPMETAEGRDGHLPILTIGWHCCSTECLHGRSPRTRARTHTKVGKVCTVKGFLINLPLLRSSFAHLPGPEIVPGLRTESLICCDAKCLRKQPRREATSRVQGVRSPTSLRRLKIN